MISIFKTALGPRDCLARPVAGVLPQAGEGVENCALACVGIATTKSKSVISTPNFLSAAALWIGQVAQTSEAAFTLVVIHYSLIPIKRYKLKVESSLNHNF